MWLLLADSDTGATNCCGSGATSNGKPEPGILGFEEQDIRQFAEWGKQHHTAAQQPNSMAPFL